MLLTPSQVSVVISSCIVVLFTGALFLSGYVVQQKTLSKLRAAVTQQMAPRPSPKIDFYLPDRFRQPTTELEDGSVVDVAPGPDPDPDPDSIDVDDVLSGGNGERGRGGVVVEVRATMPEGADAEEEKGDDGESDGAPEPRSAAADAGHEINAEKEGKPLSRAERRRRIKEEIQRLSQGDEPVYYQRRLW